MSELVLASSSPRRRAILERLGLPHRVIRPDVDESRLPGEPPTLLVARVAHAKARAVAAIIDEQDGDRPWVIGADTVVVVDGEPFGKPADSSDARAMLASLSGRSHVVMTGFSVLRHGGPEERHVESTEVLFRGLGEAEIAAYVATGEPLDKAGAYGIQGLGCFLVERIEGNYENVVGLPACPLIAVLQRLGAVDDYPPSTAGGPP